jgi:hypothetical protein
MSILKLFGKEKPYVWLLCALSFIFFGLVLPFVWCLLTSEWGLLPMLRSPSGLLILSLSELAGSISLMLTMAFVETSNEG